MGNSVYSFRDSTGAIFNPLTGPYILNGASGIGIGSITIAYATDRSSHDVAADGAIMISGISGNGGTISIEAQQTSTIHDYLVGLFNTLITAMNLGDLSNFAATTITLRSASTGRAHVCTGVSPVKIPDTPNGAQGVKVTWQLMAGDIETV